MGGFLVCNSRVPSNRWEVFIFAQTTSTNQMLLVFFRNRSPEMVVAPLCFRPRKTNLKISCLQETASKMGSLKRHAMSKALTRPVPAGAPGN